MDAMKAAWMGMHGDCLPGCNSQILNCMHAESLAAASLVLSLEDKGRQPADVLSTGRGTRDLQPQNQPKL